MDRTRLPAIVSLYLGGLLIGLTLVSFPASSFVLKQLHGYSDAQYGAIYFPQLVAAIAGALGGGALTARLGMRRLYLLSLGAFALAQASLAAAGLLQDPGIALSAVMLGTACFGFGFGCCGGPLNAYAVLLFPRAPATALTALHMMAGAGLTLAPFLFQQLSERGAWIAGPLGLLAVTLALLVVTLAATLPTAAPVAAGTDPERPWRHRFFWIAALASTVYSIAEGIFSNWAILFLQDARSLSPSTAALSLTCFWASLTLGRFAVSLLALRRAPANLIFAFPLAMIAAFAMLPAVGSAATAYLAFGFAGLACSAFFPMLVGFAAGPFPGSVSWIASMLTAAMMVGVGIGSFAIGALRANWPFEDLYRAATICPLLLLFLLAWAQRVRAAARTPAPG